MPQQHTFYYKSVRPWPNRRLKRAAIVGHTTSHTCRLWFRTGSPGDYTLLIYPKPLVAADDPFPALKHVPYAIEDVPASIRLYPFRVDNFAADTTTTQEIADLEPDTCYRYAVYSARPGDRRIVIGHDRPYHFRTLPNGRDYLLSFGFFSCHMPFKDNLFGKADVRNLEMWEYMRLAAETRPEGALHFAIAGGDQVYADGVGSLDIWKYLDKNMVRNSDGLIPTVRDMVSWYRDIYRGYWGFEMVQRQFATYPTYMIWDDHELGDGCGSHYFTGGGRAVDELNEILPSLERRNLTYRDGKTLIRRMKRAAETVYNEYQHQHNPSTPAGQYDYGFYAGANAFYVLDGRFNRDINRSHRRILGDDQHARFAAWIEHPDTRSRQFLFVVSAVPFLHLHAAQVNADDSTVADLLDIQDDLRDSWEHELHTDERKEILDFLFAATARGQRVCILSGDVHIAAAFELADSNGNVIYQLTSSAITYNTSRALGWVLCRGVPRSGVTADGYMFKRLAIYAGSNFAAITSDPTRRVVIAEFYGNQIVEPPETMPGAARAIPVPISTFELFA